jgi:hypothetical protein
MASLANPTALRASPALVYTDVASFLMPTSYDQQSTTEKVSTQTRMVASEAWYCQGRRRSAYRDGAIDLGLEDLGQVVSSEGLEDNRGRDASALVAAEREARVDAVSDRVGDGDEQQRRVGAQRVAEQLRQQLRRK